MSKVIILRKDQYDQNIIDEMVEKIFEEICDSPSANVRSILIKPNMMYYWDASTGETTDPRIVSSIIDSLRSRFGEDVDICVVESDASAMRTKYAFKVLGYDKLCEKKGVGLVNLSDGEIVKKKVQLNKGTIDLKVNRLLLSADFVVNVPKLKVHRNPPVLSGALKNFFGLISTRFKFQYHTKLELYVSAINKLVKPNLVIVDGLVVLGKFPNKMGLIIGSDDPVSCDIVASKIAGRNPKRDLIISTALRESLYETNFQLVDPDSVLEAVREDFPQLNPFMTSLKWSIQLKLLRMYARLLGDILPPILRKN